jgi:hypothetical protein
MKVVLTRHLFRQTNHERLNEPNSFPPIPRPSIRNPDGTFTELWVLLFKTSPAEAVHREKFEPQRNL